MIRMIAAIRGALALLLLTAAVPAVLVALAGSPIPISLSSIEDLQDWLHDPLQPRFAAGTAGVVAWLVWAAVTAAVLRNVAARLPRLAGLAGHRLTSYLPRPVQGLTATVLG